MSHIDEKKKLSQKIYNRQVKKRLKKIQHILDSFPERKVMLLLDNQDRLPQAQLWTASQQYALGFYDSCLLSSAFASEYALVIRLNERLTEEQKRLIAIKGLSFSQAIATARKEGLIEERLSQDLLMLGHLRNMAAHPSNYVTLFRQLAQSNPLFTGKPLENWLTDVIGKKPNEAYKEMKNDLQKKALAEALEKFLSYKDKRYEVLPDIEWAAHRPTLRAQIPIVKKYSANMVKDMLLNKALIKIVKKPDKAVDFISNRYSYAEDIAIDSIRIGFETLKQLHFL